LAEIGFEFADIPIVSLWPYIQSGHELARIAVTSPPGVEVKVLPRYYNVKGARTPAAINSQLKTSLVQVSPHSTATRCLPSDIVREPVGARE
jgi:hypothetical protein